MTVIKISGRYLLEKIFKHSTALSSVLALVVLWCGLTFLYYNLYQPMNDIISIYSLRNNVKFSVIDERDFLKVYNNIQDKLEQPLMPFNNITSPF